jgi:F420-non-reducing hydrogenase iron-sulfur subunit
LDTLGLQKERLNLKWISASEGRKFAEAATKMTEDIRQIGPSPMKREF